MWAGRDGGCWLAIVAGLAILPSCGGDVESVHEPSNGSRAISKQADADLIEARSAPWFADEARARGLVVSHAAPRAREYFFPASMAPGIAWIDYDRDGDLDVLVAVGASGDATSNVGEVSNDAKRTTTVRLFKQDERHSFHDVTVTAGLAVSSIVQGFAVGDVDNDGYDDVFITGFRGDHLLHNERGERFVDITEKAGIGRHGWSTSAAFLDFDRDGWLDLFVCQYVDYDPSRPCITASGREDFCNPAMFGRSADKLYRNLGGAGKLGLFEDESERTGIARERGAGLGVICADFNDDGWPDIYVANDGHGNFLWINQEGKSFRNDGIPLGVANDLNGRGQGSMGVAAEDVNGDSQFDLFVTNLDGENNALYLSDANAGFLESSSLANLARPSYGFTGFGTGFIDVDNDGRLDIVVANGRVTRRASSNPIRRQSSSDGETFWDEYAEVNHLYLNRGNGRYAVAQSADDPFLARPDVSRGLAIGDFDDDGRVDMLVSVVEGTIKLFKSVDKASGHWISLRLVDPRYGGRIAIGAIVDVRAGDLTLRRQATSAGSYLSAHDSRVHFGVGSAEKIDDLRVTWPDGLRERFAIREMNRVVTLERGTSLAP